MTIRPSNPEIITVNSEALETQIRDLLPSQNGFGSELQASNVITPIIDLTAAAEGSGLPDYLQTALAFGSNTAFAASNSTVLLVNTPGFYRIIGTASTEATSSGTPTMSIQMSDGLSTKDVWSFIVREVAGVAYTAVSFELVVVVRAGGTVSAVSNIVDAKIQGSHRQIATGDGTLVQPNGFPL